MTGLSVGDIKAINRNLKLNKAMFLLLILGDLLLVYFLLRYLKIPIDSLTSANEVSTHFSIIAIILSTFAISSTICLSYYNETTQLNDKLRDDKIKKKEDEIKHLENSISLFYVPLQNLLTFSNDRGLDEIELKRLNEINGNKHLAENRVQFIFEIYLQRNEESKKVSKKLLSLVCRDLEDLQKKLIKLRNE